MPARADRPDDVGIAELGKLAALLDALADRGRIAPGLRRVHVTEFGYETLPTPGRPTLIQATQARWLTWAERLAAATPGVVSFAQFLLRDQPPGLVKVSDSPVRAFGQYSTGLERADGTPKLAASTFVAGLFARAAGPRAADLWVRLRLGTRAKRVSITTRDPRPAPTTEAVLDGDGRRSYPRAGPPETAQEPKKHARGLQDLIRATQLTVLAAQPLELLALQRGQLLGALAGIGLCLAHPRAQRLRTDTEILGDLRDRTPRLKHRPHSTVPELLRVLP